MFTFRVKPDIGEPFDLTVSSRDVVMWEKMDRNNTITRLEANPSMVDLYWVTHIAAKRQNLFPGVLAEWENSVDLEPLDSDLKSSDPTRPAR